MGVATAANATPAVMASNIRSIETTSNLRVVRGTTKHNQTDTFVVSKTGKLVIALDGQRRDYTFYMWINRNGTQIYHSGLVTGGGGGLHYTQTYDVTQGETFEVGDRDSDVCRCVTFVQTI